MAQNTCKKNPLIESLLAIVLIVVTVCYTIATINMAILMAAQNRAELRPYLYVKFPKQAYFSYDDNTYKLEYTLTNNGKVSATEIIRSYKVYKIAGEKTIITRPTYINTDFVYSLAPQEKLERAQCFS